MRICALKLFFTHRFHSFLNVCSRETSFWIFVHETPTTTSDLHEYMT